VAEMQVKCLVTRSQPTVPDVRIAPYKRSSLAPADPRSAVRDRPGEERSFTAGASGLAA
jgi:hypothetical protein